MTSVLKTEKENDFIINYDKIMVKNTLAVC